MKVTGIRLGEAPGGQSELAAQVSIEHPRPKTYPIWFRGPKGCFGDGPRGDIFLAALLVPAMFLHEELEIEGEVSRELKEAAYERLEPQFLKWHPEKLRPAPLRGARIVEATPAPGAGTGCMFSGGVDSMYSLARRLDEVSHLIFIGGFELPWKREDLKQDALAHLHGLAGELGREVVEVSGSLQRLVNDISRKLSFELRRPAPGFLLVYYFGCMLVAFNLCLRGRIGRTIIPSSWTEDNEATYGSHPELERNWSTSFFSFELDGADTSRIDKIVWLHLNRPDLLGLLRVCVNPPGGGVVNCGRCSKCLRTMMEMRAGGLPETAYGAFAQPLDLRLVRRSFYKGDGGLTDDLLNRARAAGDEELVRSVEIMMGKRFHAPRVIEGWRLRIRAWRKVRRKVRRKARRDAASAVRNP